MIVQPCKQGSTSARRIADALGCKLIRIKNTRYKGNGPIINWGSSKQLFDDKLYINTPTAVHNAVNKYRTFLLFREHEVSTVEWTTMIEVATEWFNAGIKVVQRDSLCASSGRGIVLCNPETAASAPCEDGKLWTKYAPKYDEYRVHVVNGEVIDYVQKKRRTGTEASSEIRSASNGWVFCRQGVDLPEPVRHHSIRAVNALGLTFGATDVGYTRRTGTARVYEVNTAPGVEGTTIDSYAAALARLDVA